MAEFDDIQKARQELERLRREFQALTGKSLFKESTKDLDVANTQIAIFTEELKRAQRQGAGLSGVFGDLNQQLKANLSELDKSNNSLNAGKRAYRDIVNTVRQLADEESGIDKLSFAQLKKLKARNLSATQEVRLAAQRFVQETGITSEQDRRFDALEDNQQALVRAYQDNFAAEQKAARFVEYRLDLERKVLDSLKLTGGALQGIGNLASSLGLAGFSESITEITEQLQDDLRKKIRSAAQAEFVAQGSDASKAYGEALTTIEEIKQEELELAKVGKKLSAEKLNQLKAAEDILDANEENVQALYEQQDAATGLTAKLKASAKAARELGKQLMDPVFFIGSMVKGFMELDQKAVDFQRLTGQNVKALANQNTALVLGTEVIEQMTQFAKDTNRNMAALFDSQQLGRIAESAKLLGLGAEGGSKLAQNLAMSNMSVAEFEQSALDAGKSVVKAGGAGINLGQVLADTATTSDAIALSLGNNPEAIAKATAEAQRLGLNLQQMDGIANSMLDFESSIQNELEAQLLTGKQINLAKAREAALNNDLAALSQEIGENNALTDTFTSSNRIQQEAMAKALGMSRNDLAKMIVLKKLDAKLGEEEVARQMGLSVEQVKQISTQEKFNTAIGRLKQSLGPLIDAMIPIVDILTAALRPVSNMIARFTEFGSSIRTIFERDVKGAVEDTMDKVGDSMNKSPMGKFLSTIGGGVLTVAGLGAGSMIGKFFLRGTRFSPMHVTDKRTPGLFKSLGDNFKQLIKGNKSIVKDPRMASGFRDVKTGQAASKGAFKAAGRGAAVKGIGKSLLKGSGVLSLLSVGTDLISNLSSAAKSEDKGVGDAALRTLDQNKFMALGAIVGSVIPGVGTLIGAGIGGALDLANNMILGEKGMFTDSLEPPAQAAEGGITTQEGLVNVHPQEAIIPLNQMPQLSLEGLNAKFDEMIAKLDQLSNIRGDVYIDGYNAGQAIFASSNNLPS